MPHYCAALGCSKYREDGLGFAFFSFPNKDHDENRWVTSTVIFLHGCLQRLERTIKLILLVNSMPTGDETFVKWNFDSLHILAAAPKQLWATLTLEDFLLSGAWFGFGICIEKVLLIFFLFCLVLEISYSSLGCLRSERRKRESSAFYIAY